MRQRVKDICPLYFLIFQLPYWGCQHFIVYSYFHIILNQFYIFLIAFFKGEIYGIPDKVKVFRDK